jgi:hypothetical protein
MGEIVGKWLARQISRLFRPQPLGDIPGPSPDDHAARASMTPGEGSFLSPALFHRADGDSVRPPNRTYFPFLGFPSTKTGSIPA